MYLLLTANNDAWGSFNGLRPLAVDFTAGNVTLGHRVDVNGGFYANAGIMVTGGFTSQGAATFNAGSDFNGYLNVNNGNNLGVSGNVTAYGGQIVCYNSNLNGFYVQNNNGHYMRMYDDTQGHIEISSGTLYICYTNNCATYFGGTIICFDFVSRGNISANGNYIWMAGTGGQGVNNANAGPLVYMDANNTIIKMGSNGAAVFRVRRYDAVDLFTVDSGGSGVFVGNMTANGVIYTNHVYMNNACILYGRDTVGTPQWLIGLWSDNTIYVGDNSRTLHLRGSVNVFDNQIQCPTITVGGLLWQNYNSGWWWTGSPIHTDSDIQCNNLHTAASITCNGWYYSGSGNGGAQIRCWAGDWGAMSYAMSGAYFEVSPDQGASGYYFANAGNWSDARLKLNIRDSEIDALAVLGRIPVRAFEWTEEGQGLMPRDGPSVACGIVAQELEALLPSAVDIVPIAGGLAGGGMRRIVSDQLDAYYIRAIQQLTEELAAVKAQLAQLGRLLSP